MGRKSWVDQERDVHVPRERADMNVSLAEWARRYAASVAALHARLAAAERVAWAAERFVDPSTREPYTTDQETRASLADEVAAWREGAR